MIALLLGLLVLTAAVLLARWYTSADVKTVKRSLQWVGIGLLAAAMIFLAVTGRLGAALGVLAAIVVWGWRILNVIHLGRQFGGMFGAGRKGNTAGDAQPPPSSPMTQEEAYRILGLGPGAGEDEIKAAHRRLIAQIHPDHGGTDYLAAKVNQAKDFLLKRLGVK